VPSQVAKCDSVVVFNPASAIGVFLLLKSPEHVGLDPDPVARRHAYDFRISSNRSPKLICNCIEFVYAHSGKSISEFIFDFLYLRPLDAWHLLRLSAGQREMAPIRSLSGTPDSLYMRGRFPTSTFRGLPLPGYTARRFYKPNTYRGFGGVHNLTTNDKIVSGYFEVKFVFGEFNFCEFDSRPGVGEIDYRARKTAAVIQDDLGWFKHLPPPELPSLWLLLYRQIVLDRKSFCCVNLHTPEDIIFSVICRRIRVA
jgi:hypothetical protein